MDDVAIGRLVRLTRVRRRLRQEDLALAAGVSRATVSRLERGGLRCGGSVCGARKTTAAT
ncbi:MAG TPA: helix-turn-helix transcriptional regulator [Candidatus Limnocylindrales bacterium]|nr:helix-turn-helix transcriptional regulator [Candidatus Limnocylindrales bacterium]